jgi:two-component system cell cycle sensor histidine kinase PleC
MLNPYSVRRGGLLEDYASRLAEAAAVRRAELEARAARAQAELSIKARSEFLSNMNHELRTPLNAIIGFATMLKEGETYALSDEQRQAYAEYVIQSADLLLGHINTILETAELDGGAVEIDREELDLARILADAVERAQVAAAAAGVAIELKGAPDGVEAFGDVKRAGQAVDHLLRTAVKASAKGSKILVRATANPNGWAEIAVRDNGAGLPDDAIKQALSVFDEVHRGLDRSFAGPGVGLAIAKTFVEMQGGRFDIKSRVGEGTIVRITLPPPQAAATPARQSLREAG